MMSNGTYKLQHKVFLWQFISHLFFFYSVLKTIQFVKCMFMAGVTGKHTPGIVWCKQIEGKLYRG